MYRLLLSLLRSHVILEETLLPLIPILLQPLSLSLLHDFAVDLADILILEKVLRIHFAFPNWSTFITALATNLSLLVFIRWGVG